MLYTWAGTNFQVERLAQVGAMTAVAGAFTADERQ
jgi:hypothetical protein